MFDKLEDILVRLEEILNELNEPTVANDAARFQKLRVNCSLLQTHIMNINAARRLWKTV